MAKQNSKNYKNEVLDLQNMLYTVSKFENGVPDVIPDGVFGHKTSQAISKFQQRAGISPSGVADSETWKALSQKHREIVKKNKPAQPIKLFKGYVKKGQEHDSVVLVQMLFNRLSREFSVFEKTLLSGVLDDKTQKNLREFQRISKLDPHGEIDRDSWEMIATYYNNFSK